MFTGIIRELGTVARVERSKGFMRLTIQASKVASSVQVLESVAVNGVCLSVVSQREGTMTFEIIPETQHLTTLARLRPGERVNLEPSLRLVDRLSGHLVFGHVDGVGTIKKRRESPGELALHVRVTQALNRFLVPKGAVALDGVSLTIGQTLRDSIFTVHLIPETLRHTTLGACQVGDCVNVELDYFSKLTWQFLARSHWKQPK